jgi:hypothetical protein
VRAIRKYMKIILLLSNLCSTAARGGVFGAADLKRDAAQADPISGLYWIRVTDPVRPSAPPRLVRLSGLRRPHPPATNGPICVRAGDHIRLDGVATPMNSMTLEAVSFENAACGNHVHARIAVTGKLVDVMVTATGSGVLLEPSGVSR